MKVSMLMDSLGTGGTEWQLAYLAPELARLGVEIQVIGLLGRPAGSSDEVERSLVAAGVRVETIDAPSGWDVTFIGPAVLRHLGRFGPQVVHGRLLFSRLYAGLGTVLRPQAGFVLSFHNLYYWQPEKWRHRLVRQWLDLALHRIRRPVLAAVSRAAARCYAEALRVPTERIEVVPNAVPSTVLDRPHADGARVRARYQADNGALLIVSVCRLVSQKGIDVLLDASSRLAREGLAFRWIVAGRGPLLAELRARHGALEVGDRVELLGYDLGREAVYDLVGAADLFVLPSRFEGFPNALAEAMALGTPVISTRAGGMLDLVDERDGSGCLVAPDDPQGLAQAVGELARRPERRAAMGAAGRRRIQDRFGAKGVAERWLSLYERALGCSR